MKDKTGILFGTWHITEWKNNTCSDSNFNTNRGIPCTIKSKVKAEYERMESQKY